MIKWFKRNHDNSQTEPAQVESIDLPIATTDLPVTTINEQEIPAKLPEPSKEGILARFKRGLSRTRHQLGDSIGQLLLGKKEWQQSRKTDTSICYFSTAACVGL